MFDRANAGERAILVHLNLDNPHPADQQLTEFADLARSAGAAVLATITGSRQSPDPKYFVGLGKAQEIQQAIIQHDANLVMVNHDLSPAQIRNLEQIFKCRVLDRNDLILDIFAQRARSFEGKLQVELALLQHISTRLVRGWTHLERQKGGIGLRGPGETQLETDRRLIRERIKLINKRLKKVEQQRGQSRRTRHRAAIPTVALVGYTNAGKSSLFNLLTNADSLVADQLFATLDPTLRRVDLPGAGPTILIDTVGFISNIPHELINAFSATLEETRDADLLLHVVDFSDAHRRDKIEEVNQVLDSIGARDIPQIIVYNKIDLVSSCEPHIDYHQNGLVRQLWISTLKQQGITELLKGISQHLFGDPLQRHVCITPQEGQLRAQLYQLGAILDEKIDEQGNWLLHIRIAKTDFERLFAHKNLTTTIVDDN
ncbi:MAG: GTPase HflX [Gammaproteobacteria bacterium]